MGLAGKVMGRNRPAACAACHPSGGGSGVPTKSQIMSALAIAALVLAGVFGGSVCEASGEMLLLAQAGGGFSYGHKPLPKTEGKKVVRIGYFPNVTHAQALIGLANGAFQAALGPDVVIDPYAFNAGPSAVEALFGGAIDFTYIGPNPAINAYVKSKGEAVRIVAGACSGGAALVVRADAKIESAKDFSGKRIATPQLGNTQDVAARAWLKGQGLTLKEKGGDVEIIPMKNPDQLALFLKKDIQAAWAVEPWASRLIAEGGGKLFLDERSLWPNGQFVTVHILASTKFLREQSDLMRRWLKAHVELTQWINTHQEEGKKALNGEIERLVGKALRKEVLDEAFSRMELTYDPIKNSLFASARAAYELGFLGKERPDIAGIYDLGLLNGILKEKRLKPIE
jgi:NitT/TauT family transport system substrate-binding protein